MAARVGQQLGNYRLIRLLGRGSFADVYLGEHIHLMTEAAVKVLRTHLTSEEVEHFRDEARTVARLSHPHIVRVLDFGVEDKVPFLVMDYAPNGSLRALYPKGTRLPSETVVSYVKQVASALQHAHEERLVHRDVKPENMLLGRRREVLLSDFGIALTVQSSRFLSTDTVAGTIAYMAPEQLTAHPCSASDQYSLGIVAYEWLCGERPFHGSVMEIAAQHQLVPPPSLREKAPTLSAGIEQVIFTALAKEPSQRFASVQDFASALEQANRVSPDAMLPVGLPPNNASVSDASSAQLMRLTSSNSFATMPLPSQSPHHTLSRRAFVIGASGLAAIGAGGLIWWTSTFRSRVPSLPPSPTPPLLPLQSITSTGTMYGFDLQHSRFNSNEQLLSPTNVARLVPYWTAKTGNLVSSSPTVANGIVYVGSDDSMLYAFDARTGAMRWAALTGDKIYSSPAIVANRIVYVGSEDGRLYAFIAQTGQLLWKSITGDMIFSSPAVANGTVYIASNDYKVHAFNATTGATLWIASTNSSLLTSPAVANGAVYIGSRDKNMYAFDAQSGSLHWAVPLDQGIDASAAVVNSIVYIGSRGGKFYALNAQTGATLWTVATNFIINSSAAVAYGIVYVGSRGQTMYAFHATTGVTLWTAPIGGGIQTSPTVANGVVYVGADDGNLYAFHAQTGVLLWKTPVGVFYSCPAVADGVVYIGSVDHKLYAFHLPATP